MAATALSALAAGFGLLPALGGADPVSASPAHTSSLAQNSADPPTPGTTFVANTGANSITEYAPGANGNATPTATISGANTGLSQPAGVGLDISGDLFVTNIGNNSITEYAPGANGNATPTATISGGNTGLDRPFSLGFDSSGHLVVANQFGNSLAGSVTEYAPGASGNATPTATIEGTNTGLNRPIGLGFDSSGDLFVTNPSGNASVTEYAPGASGNATPTATISGTNTGLAGPSGLGFDGSGDLVVANQSANSVTEYAPGATGNVTPKATISGTNTGLNGPFSLGFDGSGDLFVANFSGNSVTEYAPGASGNATPTNTISGTNTGLNGPDGLAVAPNSPNSSVVNSNTDPGPANPTDCNGTNLCTLRDAIGKANTTGGTNTITFAPNVTSPIVLDTTVGQLEVTNTSTENITITGNGSTVVDGNHGTRILQVDSGATVSLMQVTLQNGSSGSNNAGGAIQTNGTLTVTNSTLSGNSTTSAGGGAIDNNGGKLTVTNTTLSGNTGSVNGGAISNESSGALTLTNSTLSGNHSVPVGNINGSGGGISNTGNATSTVSNSTLSGNSATDGGGIHDDSGGTSTVTNSTLSGNSSSTSGGGIHHDSSGTSTLINSTLSGNSAPTGSGINNASGTETPTNTIVADNTGSPNCNGTITDGGYNLENGTSCGFSNHNVNAEPALGPLQNNGGPTQTQALSSDSPALHVVPKGNCPVTDQRGVTRPQPTSATDCDIGAYELLPVVVDDAYTVTSGTPLSVPAPGVLINDTDTVAPPMSATLAAQASNGTVTLDKDGSFTYTSNSGFTGTDTFTYTASDTAGFVSGPATVTITVTPAFAAPSATTQPATNVGTTTASLNGSVNPNASDTHYHFEYGTTTSYGSTTPSTDVGSGHSPVSAAADISGLAPNTTYHFQLVASNATGTTNGGDLTFRTLPDRAYHPLTPDRITDTRPGSGLPNAGKTLQPGSTLDVQVTGAGGVPATGVTAAVLNVTATNPTKQSFLTVSPTGATRPTASNLNFSPGQTVANLTELGVGTNGRVSIYNPAGSVDVVVDVEGYVGPSATPGMGLYNPLTPERITDTRQNSGVPNTGKTLGPNTTLNVQVTGAGGVPSSGVSAVVLNVTATNPTAQSYLTVWPAGATRPSASNLNFSAGQTVPNRVQVPVGTGGQVSIFNPAGSVDVVVDVGGYFTDNSNPSATGAQFTATTPARITDTRPGSGLPNAGKTLGPGGSIKVQVSGAGGVPATGVTAAVMNVTVTNTTGQSFLTVWPTAVAQPPVSDLNWVAGQTVPNLVVLKLGSDGAVQVFNAAGSTDVVVDVMGWYS